mmetsp:Transcript_2696/g.9060  ORF Transcript_2696/g.9060 Transcript_2696/m.9060 type:complete len:200 (-) Transcript_2696:1265-1864(-)
MHLPRIPWLQRSLILQALPRLLERFPCKPILFIPCRPRLRNLLPGCLRSRAFSRQHRRIRSTLRRLHLLDETLRSQRGRKRSRQEGWEEGRWLELDLQDSSTRLLACTPAPRSPRASRSSSLSLLLVLLPSPPHLLQEPRLHRFLFLLLLPIPWLLLLPIPSLLLLPILLLLLRPILSLRQPFIKLLVTMSVEGRKEEA